MENIDFEALRRYLMDYFGTASTIFPIALFDLAKVQCASDSELVDIAINNNIDLDDFTYNYER